MPEESTGIPGSMPEMPSAPSAIAPPSMPSAPGRDLTNEEVMLRKLDSMQEQLLLLQGVVMGMASVVRATHEKVLSQKGGLI